ncbi:MAG: uroporphyrinogen decarboxylase family protein [Clostridia bacterium]|nr:uroporphyrinogen decarboxylase family protein [Clostridia bacterium]
MNIKDYLWGKRGGLPILSFPAVQKSGITVEEMCKDTTLAAEAMVYVANNTATLAAVSPMDLSLEAEAFGATVRFAPMEVPAVTGQLVSSPEEAEALEIPALTAGRIPHALETVRLAAERITDKPVIAGMIGPFSLAGRLMDVTEILYTCYDEPETVHAVMEKTTAFLISYAKALGEAGAVGVMMAEPLTGILSPDLAEKFSIPYVTKLISAVQTEEFAIIYHNCGNSILHMAQSLFTQGAAAYHFGNAVPMKEMLKKAPADILCMGNIDPVSKFSAGTPDEMKQAVAELLEDCKDYPNFLPSSGCDIPAHVKWENIHAFFEALS